MLKSTKIRTVFLLGLLLLGLASCDKKTERTYDLLPPSPEEEKDMTDVGDLFVNIENSGGDAANEGSKKVVDGAADTKFLTNPFIDTMWMELNLIASQRIDAYTLTSANDAESRDPMQWTLKASTDRENWVELDHRENELFSARFEKRRFEFENPEKYKYYRLYIEKVNGSSLFQLAEWRIISRPEDAE
ncbi:discoidin domain-containing protein [Chitinophaga caeni]|nr:discoidin domain-containing protein [Chitinophaga caeni]